MSMMESVAYLKGLAQGLDIDGASKEGKLFSAIIDVLDEMASSINDVEEVCDELDELVDIIDEDLGSLEEDFYGDDDDDDDDDMLEDELYEVTCPSCDNVVYLDEDMILDGEISCPECGQKLEFDLDGCSCGDGDDCDCEDNDCGCGCHGDKKEK